VDVTDVQARAVPPRLLRYLLETVTLLDRDGTVVFSSHDGDGLLGHPAGTIAGSSSIDHVHPEERATWIETWQWVLDHPGVPVRGEFRVRHVSDGWNVVEGMAVNLLDEPDVAAIVLTTRNVTERVAELEQADALRERFEALVQQTSDLVILTSADGAVAYASPAVHRFLGGDPLQRTAAQLFVAIVHPDDRAHIEQASAVARERPGEPVPVSWRGMHADGGVRHLDGLVTDLRAVPSVAGYVVNARDVTDRRSFEDQLLHRSLHDVLTGLPNRTLLLDRVEGALVRGSRTGRGVAVLFCDLDRFKAINDSLGHGTGDVVLQEVARRVTGVVRHGDTVARFGGDELVVVCEDLESVEPAIHVAERIVEALRPPVHVSGHDLHVTTSVGVAHAEGHAGATAEALMRDADLAMYHAKDQGKDRVAVFDASLHERALRRVALDADLRRAVGCDELQLWLQPVVHLPSGRVRSVEALVRWQHPELGLVPPGDFLGVAEETGVIVDIDRWVVAAACRAGAQLARGSGPTRRVWCNLSARSLRRDDVADWLLGEAAAAGLDPGGLGVEITESVLLEHAVEAAEALGELRSAGVRIALDDFGTGYSSLAYLRRVPVDVLKVDRSFVQDVTERSGAAVVRAVVAMAESLGLDCVAEGVETDRQLATLRVLGCPGAQGYLLGRPQPAHLVVDALVADGRPTVEPVRRRARLAADA
jgi:diguanylate cyclase (GGDEF)-like protein/PAS domain S-box-containing protein